MAIINVILTGEEEKHAVSVVTSSFLIKKQTNKQKIDPEVIYQNIHLHPAFKGDPTVN